MSATEALTLDLYAAGPTGVTAACTSQFGHHGNVGWTAVAQATGLHGG